MSVGDGIVRALRERPCMLHRFPRGVDGEKVHQKRLPKGAPPWVRDRALYFPRFGRTADELCVTELASVIWAVQMSTVEFHPWNSRRADVEKPRRVADRPRSDAGLRPRAGAAGGRASPTRCSTSSERSAGRRPRAATGMHIYVRIQPRWGFADVRRAALAFAREVERRVPDDVTTTWWRKDRDPRKVFVDYNQNARDHTIASAYSVRGRQGGDRLHPDHLGRGRRRRARGLHDPDGPGALRASRRPACRDRRRRVLARPAARVGRPRRARG